MKEMCDKMKLKFSKTLAIACILCMTFATLTAFAADNKVETITNYDFTANQTELTIETKVHEVESGDEITYYVANDSDIVYIDQATATGTTVNFTFTAAKTDLFNVKTLAKNGSDKGYTFPEFKFTEFCNYMTDGAPTVTPVDGNWKVADDSTYSENAGVIFQGKVTGTVTKYGVKLDDEPYLAQGCNEDGIFTIKFEGLTVADLEGVTVEAYAE